MSSCCPSKTETCSSSSTPSNNTTQFDAIQLLESLMDSFIPSITPSSKISDLTSSFTSSILAALSSDLKVSHKLSRRYKDLSLENGSKGIPFPVTITTNSSILSSSPSSSKEEVLKEGDLVKFSASLHLDGYPAYKTVSLLLPSTSSSNSELVSKRQNLLQNTIEIAQKISESFSSNKKSLEIRKSLSELSIEKNLAFPEGLLLHSIGQYIVNSSTFIAAPFTLFKRESGKVVPKIDEEKFENFSLEEGSIFELHLVTYSIEDFTKSKYFQKMERNEKKNVTAVEFTEGKLFAKNYYDKEAPVKLSSAIEVNEMIESRFGAYVFEEEAVKDIRGGKLGINSLVKSGIVRNVQDSKMNGEVDVCEVKVMVRVGKEKGEMLGKI